MLVGRERELAAFLAWEASGEGEVLNVSGPGGVGKTALLGAFALASTRPVIQADGRVIEPTREALLAAVGDPAGALLIIDAFEGLGDLTRFVREELLPGLSDPRVVIAGRSPLAAAWRGGERWPVRIRALPLNRLGAEEARGYLQFRGVAGELAEQILAACGGWPLALSLAADLVEQFGVRRLSRAPEWHLAVNALVEQLLDEAADPQLRALLEAGSVVRRFDEALLAALVGEDAAAEAFGALCRLSVVRATDHGLALHDDLRRLVADDLRWRRPERHVQLRLRALEKLAERVRDAPPEERGRLLHERLFLWEPDARGRVGAQARVRVVPLTGRAPARPRPRGARPHGRRRRLQRRADDLRGDARVRLRARGDAGVRGRVSAGPRRAAAARAPRGGRRRLPLPPRRRGRVPGPDAGGAAARLPDRAGGGWRLPVLGRPGRRPRPRRGARLRAGAGSEGPLPRRALQGYALDLRRIGVELWLQGLLSDARVPAGPGELERELQAVLAEWHDDRRVAESSLAPLGDVRALVLASLELARERCAPGQELSLRAIERAYVERTVSHERVADELHVSRATFYRLLPRGVGLVAAALPDAASRLRQG